MRYEIKVERLTGVTFNQWTDGSEVVIDMMAVGIDTPADRVTYMSAMSVGHASAFIADFPYPVGTFFVIAKIRDFLALVDHHPTRDLRLLVV